jgi:hypothetical protein
MSTIRPDKLMALMSVLSLLLAGLAGIVISLVWLIVKIVEVIVNREYDVWAPALARGLVALAGIVYRPCRDFCRSGLSRYQSMTGGTGILFAGWCVACALFLASVHISAALWRAVHVQAQSVGYVALVALVGALLGAPYVLGAQVGQSFVSALFLIAVVLGPLGIAWGAGAMVFGGKHGPQTIGASVVGVLVFGCNLGAYDISRMLSQ